MSAATPRRRSPRKPRSAGITVTHVETRWRPWAQGFLWGFAAGAFVLFVVLAETGLVR